MQKNIFFFVFDTNFFNQAFTFSRHRENICRADPGSGSATHPIHIDPSPSTPDPVSSTRNGSTGILIYSRALSLDI